MAEYIEREEFLAEQRHLYCDNCERRKNSNGKLAYDIGDAPCRACGICDVLDAVEDAPAADVRPVVRGKWVGNKRHQSCSECHMTFCVQDGQDGEIDMTPYHYCPNCGTDMREGE